MTESHADTVEMRLRALEDRAEIAQLIASYGPSVDSGSAEETASLWLRDGRYEFSAPVEGEAGAPAVWALDGHDEIVTMVNSDRHQNYITHGSAHFVGAPHITVNRDEAVAITYSLLLLHEQENSRFVVERMGANRWELERAPEGWKVRRRTQSMLDGQAVSRDILREAAGQSRI